MKKIQKKIYFLNDQNLYNQRYRGDLMVKLSNSGFLVGGFGVFDSVFSFIRVILILLIPSQVYKHAIVVSNIKSNIFSMLFFASKALVIVNGLGRYRGSKLFRFLLLLLMNCNYRKIFAIQNYADYRYFSKYSISKKKLKWIPGSGGVKRTTGVKSGYSVVQRPDKLELVKSDIYEAVNTFDLGMIYIVGCNGSWEDVDSTFVGRVDQDNIFQFSNGFIQPGGYGEGFPHTLADAIASNMNIIISKKQYIGYGLKLMDGRLKNPEKSWSELITTTHLKERLSLGCITGQYYRLCISMYKA